MIEAIAKELLESGLCAHGERNEFRHAYECEICLPKALARAHAEGKAEGLALALSRVRCALCGPAIRALAPHLPAGGSGLRPRR